MAPGMALLLGLVSALDQRLWAHSGSSSQPCIWAVPGAVIPHGRPVSIFCRGPPGTTSLRLHQSKPRGEPYDRHLEGGQEMVEFSLQGVTQAMAGVYYCHYWKKEIWSECTESLELMVTGPAHPTVIVVSSTAAAFLLLVLLLLLLCLCRHRAKRRAAHHGTKSQRSFGPCMQIQGDNKEGILEDLEPEADGQRDTQVSMAEDPREVTYAQLWPEGLRESAAPLPSCEPEEPSTQPCVYATFTLS